MKKYNTEYFTEKVADLSTLSNIVRNLFTNTSEEWLTVYDDAKPNADYIQVHAGIEYEKDHVSEYLERAWGLSKDAIRSNDQLYLVEYRQYDQSDAFKHYRTYLFDASVVMRYIENYMNDVTIDVGNWIDVTDQFA